MYYELIKALDNSYVPNISSPIPMEISFMAGRIINEKLESPLNFLLENISGDVLPDYMSLGGGKLLFSKRLINTLTSSGVDNLQLFPAVIHVKNLNILFKDYYAVNILGLVKCVDMIKSDYTEIMPDLYEFSRISINMKTTRAEKIFRIAESNRRVLIHDSVIQYIISNPLIPELSGFDVREIDQE